MTENKFSELISCLNDSSDTDLVDALEQVYHKLNLEQPLNETVSVIFTFGLKTLYFY